MERPLFPRFPPLVFKLFFPSPGLWVKDMRLISPLLPSYCPCLDLGTPHKALTIFPQTSDSIYSGFPLLRGIGSLLHPPHAVFFVSSLAPSILGSCCCFSLPGSPPLMPLYPEPLELVSLATLTNHLLRFWVFSQMRPPILWFLQAHLGCLIGIALLKLPFNQTPQLLNGRVCGQLIGPSMRPATFGQQINISLMNDHFPYSGLPNFYLFVLFYSRFQILPIFRDCMVLPRRCGCVYNSSKGLFSNTESQVPKCLDNFNN